MRIWASGFCLAAHGALLMLLVGCGQPGPPLPPSANLPATIHDFSATRRGSRILLQWTAPVRTCDGVAIRGSVQTKLCVWPGRLATLPATCPSLRPLAPGTTEIPLASVTVSSMQATLAVQEFNARDRGIGWSNPATVPLAQVPPSPSGFTATPSAQGVELGWVLPHMPAQTIHIYRRQEPDVNPSSGAPPTSGRGGALSLPRSPRQPAAPVAIEVPGTQSRYLDITAEPNHHFTYWLRSAVLVGSDWIESDDSPSIEVNTQDVFPPPVPQALAAVPSAPVPPATAASVDLSWEPVMVPDLAGYNVYRRPVGAAAWEKRNSTLLPTPVFRDALPASGSFEYAVTAVDQVGNESARSQPLLVQIPNGQPATNGPRLSRRTGN